MITPNMIKTLREDDTLKAIYPGTVISTMSLQALYDIDYDTPAPDLTMEPNDEVIVTEHTDGKFYVHFLSLQKGRYHYKAPWTTDDQVTHEGAIYHV